VVEDESLAGELAAVRSRGAAALVAAAAAAAHGQGSSLCVTCFGSAFSARVRGLSPESVAAADRVLFGLATLTGDALAERLLELRPLAGAKPVTTSLNWAPERTAERLAADARRAVAGGASGLALYNLSMVPDAGLDAFRAAAAAFKESVL